VGGGEKEEKVGLWRGGGEKVGGGRREGGRSSVKEWEREEQSNVRRLRDYGWVVQ